MRWIAYHVEEGGWGMYPLFWCLVIALALTAERAFVLLRSRPCADALIEALRARLRVGDVSGALGICAREKGALARIGAAGIFESMESIERVEAALATRLMLELQPLERRLGYLAIIVQLATLFGLLGTMTGMVVPFGGSCGNADATSRATMLARGISESMNCTVGGLFVSLVAMLSLWLLQGRARTLAEELSHGALAMRNLLVEHREHLRWNGARAPLDRATYRTAR